MPCTSYGDLGKPAKDIFNKGYHIGLFKFEWVNKTKSGLQFTATGENQHETGKTQCSIESQYKVKEHGVTLKEKWNSENVLSTEISAEDQLVEGLKLTFDGVFNPTSRKKSAKLKTAYKHDVVALNFDVDMNYQGPILNGAGVATYNGWLAGYQVAFNASEKKLSKNNLALGYQNKEIGIHAEIANGSELSGTIYRRVRDDLEAAISTSYSQNNAAKFAVGCRYEVDSKGSVRAKINNTGLLGVGYQRSVNPGVKFTISALFNVTQLNQGQHKLGCALEMEN